MRLLPLAAAALALALTPALAAPYQPTPLLPPRPAGPACRSVDYVEERFAAAHASLMVLDGEAVHRAATLSADGPAGPVEPEAERVLVGVYPSGVLAVFFVRGTGVCEHLVILNRRAAAAALTFIAGTPA